jgi:hypothetical protein
MERKRTTEAFTSTGRNLEEAFFMDRDMQLLTRRAELRKLAETKEALASVSGIKNQEILQALVNLNVRPETLAAMTAIPLVAVVWADGKVDAEEKKVVLDFAARQGIVDGSVSHELLEQWLVHAPGPELIEAWQHYIEALCERLAPAERDELRQELLRNVRAAAEATGGFLGIGKVSKEEKAVLSKLESSFRNT